MRYAFASSAIVRALADAAHDAWRAGEAVVGSARVAHHLHRRTSGEFFDADTLSAEHFAHLDLAPDTTPLSDTSGLVFETEATLREAVWHAGFRLRRPVDGPPTWPQPVRSALLQTLTEAHGTWTLRYPNHMLLLRILLGKSHFRDRSRENELFVDGEPNFDVLMSLKLFKLLAAPPRGFGGVFTTVVSWLARKRGGPLENVLRTEAARQTARTGGTVVNQPQLVMAMCAMDFALRETGLRLSPSLVPTNRAAKALADRGIGYLDVKSFVVPSQTEVGRLPGDPSWRVPAVGPPYGADLVKVRVDAGRTADRLGHPIIGTSHLLHAIVMDGDSSGSRMLRAFGIDPGDVATQLNHELC